MMRNIAEMDYDELMKLNNEILTEDELNQLEEHELVTWIEKLGYSGEHIDCYWFEVQIKHPQWENENSNSIEVYCRM